MSNDIPISDDWRQLINQLEQAQLIDRRLRNTLTRMVIDPSPISRGYIHARIASWYRDPSGWLRQVAANDQEVKITMLVGIRSFGPTSWPQLQRAAEKYCAKNPQTDLIQFATMFNRGHSDPVIYIIAIHPNGEITKYGPFGSVREAKPFIEDQKPNNAAKLYTATIISNVGISTAPALTKFEPLILT